MIKLTLIKARTIWVVGDQILVFLILSPMIPSIVRNRVKILEIKVWKFSIIESYFGQVTKRQVN